MELGLLILVGIAIVGLVVTNITNKVVDSKEKRELQKLVKANDLTEFVATSYEPDEEEEKPEEYVAIDQIVLD